MVHIQKYAKGVDLKKCSICDQKADVYTSVHKKEPFVDGRFYECVCFTCYFTPKILEQKYNDEGLVLEEIQLDYSCENLCSSKELHESGASDTPKQAKMSVEAVRERCRKALKTKGQPKRPKASWSIS